MDIQLSSIMEEYVAGIECVRVPQKYRSFLGDDQSREERKKRKLPCGSLPEKEFIARHSLLTDLFEINHIQTIYHIFIAILILLFMNTVVEDIFDKGRIDLEFALILWAFGDFQTVLVTWVSSIRHMGFYFYRIQFLLIPNYLMYFFLYLGWNDVFYLNSCLPSFPLLVS